MTKILDFKQPQLSKTEKAMQMAEMQIAGLQRQIAGICLHLKFKPNDFAIQNQKQVEITDFLVEAQKAEELIVQAQIKENTEKANVLEQFKPKENGNSL